MPGEFQLTFKNTIRYSWEREKITFKCYNNAKRNECIRLDRNTSGYNGPGPLRILVITTISLLAFFFGVFFVGKLFFLSRTERLTYRKRVGYLSGIVLAEFCMSIEGYSVKYGNDISLGRG